MKKSLIAAAVAVATWAAPTGTLAQSVNAQTDETQAPGGSEGKQEILEEILVVGKQVTYGNSSVTEAMLDQTPPVASVLDVVDNLPGVLINEGDAFGGDDWSTTISMRGFQVNLSEQQLGMTIDGIPNGNSNYGGGAKANRFIDTFNLQGVEVSQGTSDITTRSHEALGGSLNFITDDPEEQERLRAAVSFGDYNAQKFYGRFDTGEFARDSYAWISMSSTAVNSWIDQSGESTRDHFAAKVTSQVNDVGLTAYVAYGLDRAISMAAT